MSLLLEALKKAALEKQSRIESSPAPAPIPEPAPAPALPPAPSSAPSAAQPTATETADAAIQEVIDQSAEAFEPAAIAVEAPAESEVSRSFSDTVDQEAEVEAITQDLSPADDWDEIEELDVEAEDVENFDFESTANEPEQDYEREPAELVLEDTEHDVNIARLQQEALQQTQKDEQEEKARELAEIEAQRTSEASRQEEQQNRQSLDQLIASGKAVVRRSKRRSAFLYAMLVMTALGGILSYYFYLLAESGIAELQQPQATESSIDIAEIIEATELNALEVAQVSGTTEPALDTTGNAALQGRIDKDDPTINVTTIATQTELAPAESTATGSMPTELLSTESRPAEASVLREPARSTAQRADSPSSSTDYLDPMILTDNTAPQPSSVAERVIIHHPQSSRGLSEILQSAYSALQRRELQKAATLYDQALAMDANQRDALLGAAATATAHGRFDDAATYYQRRLNADPKDSFARAGLLALMNDGKSRAAVQREVTTLLAQNPESSHLHFLKGVGFASEGRWNQAQRSFYEAYSLDNSNPDYAFNLAVSLDHLSQPPLARVYYERALSLANTRTANFDVSAIQQRLLELSQP